MTLSKPKLDNSNGNVTEKQKQLLLANKAAANRLLLHLRRSCKCDDSDSSDGIKVVIRQHIVEM